MQKLWDSGVGLSGWLVRQSHRVNSDMSNLGAAARDVLSSAEGLRAVELGKLSV